MRVRCFDGCSWEERDALFLKDAISHPLPHPHPFCFDFFWSSYLFENCDQFHQPLKIMRIGLDSDPDSESSSSLCSSSGQVNFQSKLTKKDKGKARLIDSDFHDSIISSPNLTKTNPSGIRGNLANKKLIPPWIARQRQQLTTQRRSKIRFSPSSTNNSEVSSEDFDQEQNEDEDTDTDSDSNLSDHSESEGDGEGEDQNRDTQDNSNLDSEEEQWPVNPGKSNNQSKQERNRLKRDQEVVKRLIRLQSSDGTGLEESQNQIARTYVSSLPDECIS